MNAFPSGVNAEGIPCNMVASYLIKTDIPLGLIKSGVQYRHLIF